MAGASSIKTVMEFLIGIAMLPAAAGYAVYVTSDPNLSSIVGVGLIVTLGVMIIALGIIYHSAKNLFGK